MDPLSIASLAKLTAAASTANASADALGNVVERYRGFFNEYKPDITNIRINYRDCTATIDLHISCLDNKGRRTKLIVPYSPDFQIMNTYAGLYQPISSSWNLNNDRYVLKGSDIPKDCEDLLVTLKGKVDKDILDNFVKVRRSTDPFDDGETDSYWITAKIINTNVLEKMYDRFHLENVDCDVRVLVRSCFTTSIPRKLQIIMSAGSDLIRATRSGDRNVEARARHRVRKLDDWAKVEPFDIYTMIAKLIARESFNDYIETEGPYFVGEIITDENRVTPIPESIQVDAYTDLDYENDFSEGHIIFQREKFKDDIKKKAEDLSE